MIVVAIVDGMIRTFEAPSGSTEIEIVEPALTSGGQRRRLVRRTLVCTVDVFADPYEPDPIAPQRVLECAFDLGRDLGLRQGSGVPVVRRGS